MKAGQGLSVVLITPDGFDRVARTIACLERQTIHDSIELIIVAPSRRCLAELEEHSEPFAAVRVEEVGEFRTVGGLKVAGIHRASREIIAFAEDHSFPQPDWAEQLLAAWDRDAPSAVGAVMANANPGTVSWMDMLLSFGPFIDARIGGEVGALPWHNTSYRRADLLRFGADLERLMSMEFLLQDALRRQGGALRLASKARTRHVNASDLRSAVRATFWGNRMYGHLRAGSERWGPGRRALFCAAWPAIALRRWSRAMGECRRIEALPLPSVRLGVALLLGSTVAATGEAIGYAFGGGDCERHRLWAELHRAEMVRPTDRVLFDAERV